MFDHSMLDGQVAWITGGGSGIGAGIARSLAAHGARVAVTGRTQAKLDHTVAEITDAGGQAVALASDVRDPDGLAAVVAAIEAQWGRLDILVNSAAGNFLCPAVGLSPNAFGTVVDIDLKGTFLASRAAFALLSARGGSIVNITATLQYTGTPLQVHASSAKAGVDALTRGLAVEWGPAGVRVNGVAPGPIADTEGMRKLATPEVKARLADKIPLRRLGTVDDIAKTVLFLVSPASSWTTGTIVVVDGGQWLATSGLGTALSG